MVRDLPPDLGKRLGNLAELPEALRSQIPAARLDKLETDILAVLEKVFEGVASVDEILVGLFRHTGEIFDRQKIANKLYRMSNSKLLESVQQKRGVYRIPIAQNKLEPPSEVAAPIEGGHATLTPFSGNESSGPSDDSQRQPSVRAGVVRKDRFVKKPIGTIAQTGQRCPESGVWKSQTFPSTTAPIAEGNIIPPYRGAAAKWMLIQYA